jgi:hypothetical protein
VAILPKFCLFISIAVLLPALSRAPAVVRVDVPGSATIDASRLVAEVPLAASCKVAATDNPRFADKDLDDSEWASIPPGQYLRLADFHAPDALKGRQWIRLHLRIVNSTAPLGFHIISLRNELPFQVFANGNQLPVAPSGSYENNYPFTWVFFPPQFIGKRRVERFTVWTRKLFSCVRYRTELERPKIVLFSWN